MQPSRSEVRLLGPLNGLEQEISGVVYRMNTTEWQVYITVAAKKATRAANVDGVIWVYILQHTPPGFDVATRAADVDGVIWVYILQQ